MTTLDGALGSLDDSLDGLLRRLPRTNPRRGTVVNHQLVLGEGMTRYLLGARPTDELAWSTRLLALSAEVSKAGDDAAVDAVLAAVDAALRGLLAELPAP